MSSLKVHCSWEEVVLASANGGVKAKMIVATAQAHNVVERAIVVEK